MSNINQFERISLMVKDLKKQVNDVIGNNLNSNKQNLIRELNDIVTRLNKVELDTYLLNIWKTSKNANQNGTYKRKSILFDKVIELKNEFINLKKQL